jgi:uncharacterized protein (TIGR02145 family)
MKSPKIIWILFICVIGFSAYACKTEEILLHGDISGYVTDTETDQPLPTAEVILNPVNDTTSTGIDGKYLFKNLIPSNYEVEVSKTPYARDRKSAIVISANNTEVDFALHKIPYPRFSERYLDFGLDSTIKSFTITNTGTGKLKYSLTTSQEWITLTPNNGDITTETDTIKVKVNKTGLSEKKHIESIEIVSHSGQDLLSDTIGVYLNGVMDVDHNYYNVVKIGTQTWMAENLNIGKFISASRGGGQTSNNIIEKYCYDNTFSNCSVYGGLYEWDEMMQYEPQDSGKTGTTRGVCPVGWHLPTQTEVFTLEDKAGGNLVGGGNVKETGLIHWNNPNLGATNLIGFTALGGGIWDGNNGVFVSLGERFDFYSSTSLSATSVQPRWGFAFQIHNNSPIFGEYTDNLNYRNGLSVRCIMDPPKK